LIAAPLPSVEAYRLWSASYDDQPDNVVLALERELFAALLADVPLAGKRVLDVGCGTGRHWPALAAAGPRALTGADSSPEMLARLRAKLPAAALVVADAIRLDSFADGAIDVVISTLTLGHVPDADAAFTEWRRVLAPAGQLLVTDFHPEAFRTGMRRTFVHRGRTFEAENHLHPVVELRAIWDRLGMELVASRERAVDDTLRDAFARQGQAEAFRRFRGTPLVVGWHLRRR
jgi:ubiquinone/menaquinone biosynthesis C-methylase UbiE